VNISLVFIHNSVSGLRVLPRQKR